MSQLLKWIISCTAFLLLSFGGLYLGWYFNFPGSIKDVESSIESEADTALKNANLGDWASVRMEGQKASLLGEAPSIAERDRAISVLLRATGSKGPIFGGVTKVVADEVTIENPIPIESPYHFRADMQADFIRVSDMLPDETSVREIKNFLTRTFANEQIYNHMRVARGVPNDQWVDMIKGSLSALSKLDEGSINTKDLVVKFEGETNNEEIAQQVNLLLRRLPAEYTIESSITVAGNEIRETILPRQINSDQISTRQDDQYSVSKTQEDKLELRTPRASDEGALEELTPPDVNVTTLPDLSDEQVLQELTREIETENIPNRSQDFNLPNSKPNDEEIDVPAPSEVIRTRLEAPAFDGGTSQLSTSENNLPAAPEPILEAPETIIDNKAGQIFEERITATNTDNIQFEGDRTSTANLSAAALGVAATGTAVAAGTAYENAPRSPLEKIKERSARHCRNELEVIARMQPIKFTPESTIFLSSSRPTIAALADIMQRCVDHRFIIRGYGDDNSISSKNQQISEDRAKALKLYLINRGVDQVNVDTHRFGDANLTNKNITKGSGNNQIEISMQAWAFEVRTEQ